MKNDAFSDTGVDLIARWQHFWFRPIPPHVYAALRIGFGILGCITLLRLSDFDAYWSLDGLVPHDQRGWGVKQAVWNSGVDGGAARFLYAASVAAFVSFTIGFRSGLSTVLAFGASVLQAAWNYLPLSAADVVIRSVLFCLIWANCGSVWSVDAWLRTRSGSPDSLPPAGVAIAPLRLIQFQVMLIYTVSGLWKLLNPVWRDGSALHYILNSNVFHRFPQGLPVALEGFAFVATYMTLLWEIAFPFLVLFRRTRVGALLLGVVIHLGIEATLEIGLFSYVMVTGYMAFIDPFRFAAVTESRLQGRSNVRAAPGRLSTTIET